MWISLVVDDEKVKEIFDRIQAAKTEIAACLNELDRLGIYVNLSSEPPIKDSSEGK